jgi:small subunit ribosomal protein S1
MPEETIPTAPAPESDTPTESFASQLAEFEHTHARPASTGDGEHTGPRQIQATVVSLDAASVYLDIGYKTEGVLPRSAFDNNAEAISPGDIFAVSSKGRNPEGYYDLSRTIVAQPKDLSSLQAAFDNKVAVAGTVTAVVKGGLTVDIGIRAFMPASRTGTREAAEMEKLVGQQIVCRITKLDIDDEDAVVDRRVILEEEAQANQATRYASLAEGDLVTGTVRSLAAYGAFIDLNGIDGLLHVSDIAWARVTNPEDILTVGQQLQLKVLKVDPESKRISLGLKQLEPEPWDSVPTLYSVGQRVTGTVTRLMDFGAFVELAPAIEGLIHVSEMSWVKKVRKPADMLKIGDSVDAVILSIDPAQRRIGLGLKQALGDPWADAAQRFPTGATVSGPVTRITKFGAFLEISEGIEGLVHISEIVADRRLNHPSDVLRTGETVKAQVLALDPEKRQIKLSIKQLIPTGLAEYLLEHAVNDTVSGRVVSLTPTSALIELGEGVHATCPIAAPTPATTPSTSHESAPRSSQSDERDSATKPTLDLSALTSQLNARWKTGTSTKPIPTQPTGPEPLTPGQLRTFRITTLNPETQTISLTLS